jgi:hypothetical protein
MKNPFLIRLYRVAPGFIVLFAIAFLISLICLAFTVQAAAPVPFNETVKGDRNLGQEFVFTISNMSGLKPAQYHFTVYDFMILDNFSYHSVAWGQDLKQEPGPGLEYLAVWVREYLTENSTVNWAYDQDSFNAWVNITTITPLAVFLQDLPGSYIGGHWTDITPPLIPREFENKTHNGIPITRDPFGYRAGVFQGDQYPGQSNDRDGFILYEIPSGTRPEFIRVCGWFGFYGYGIWYLTPHELSQESIEQIRYSDQVLINMQIMSGVRMSDRPGARIRG